MLIKLLGHVDVSNGVAGDTFTYWNEAETLILRGGMEYNDSVYNVPKTGLYYVYAQVEIRPTSNHSSCGYAVTKFTSDSLPLTILETKIAPNEGGEQIALYVGSVVSLVEGDEVYLIAIPECRFNFLPSLSFFGLFQLVEGQTVRELN